MRRPFCAEVSAEDGEPLAATASRVDHWLLVEYRGTWARDPLAGGALPAAVTSHLGEQLDALPRARLLFIRRPDRRHRPSLACFYARTREGGSLLTGLELESYEDLLEVDFTTAPGRPLDQPLLAVCTHGKRDRCCARYGRPLYDALREVTEDDRLWQSTHVGGDRFAANLVCFPEGLYFGRVGAGDAWRVLEEYLAGTIDLDCYRGRCCYPFPVQAAERAVREATGRTGVDDLRLARVERTPGEAWRVAFELEDGIREVDVTAEPGDLTYLTCTAEMPKRPRHFAATLRACPKSGHGG